MVNEIENFEKALAMVLSTVQSCCNCWNLEASEEDKVFVKQLLKPVENERQDANP